MKMPIEVYNALVRDLELIADDIKVRPINMAGAWSVFNLVMRERNADDDSPYFSRRRRTVAQDKEEYRAGGSAYDLFYTKHGLDDTHIETALRKWAKEYHGVTS